MSLSSEGCRIVRGLSSACDSRHLSSFGFRLDTQMPTDIKHTKRCEDPSGSSADVAPASGLHAPPEFIPIPPSGIRCPWTGLKRGHIYSLLKAGKIRAISPRGQGAARGRRLLIYDSVMDYFRRLDREQNQLGEEGCADA